MKTILVVEDESAFRSILSKKLTPAGYRVITASDGKEGLNALSKDSIDLILLDLVMPNMDGQTFFYELRKGPYKNIPVIVLTNLTSMSTPEGVKEVLIKSNTKLEEIVTKINALLPLAP